MSFYYHSMWIKKSSSNAQSSHGHYLLKHPTVRDFAVDRCLYCCTIGHSLIRVDGIVQLLPIEEVLKELLHLGDPGGTSNQHDVMDTALVHLGVAHGLLHWLEGALEEVRAQLLKPGPSYGSVEVDSLKQGINLNVGLGVSSRA